MLRRVELFHFKNHKATTIDFSSPFTIIVGRNGSGKSAVMDAIEWCLFHSKSTELRASAHKDLVNANKPVNDVMAVQISLQQENKHIIQFRREYTSNNRTKMLMRRLDIDDNDFSKFDRNEFDYLDRFSNISSKQLQDLLDEMQVPHANLNRILIKQNATSIAAASPIEMLSYIESIIGTDTIKISMNNITRQVEMLAKQQTTDSAEFDIAITEMNKIRPHLVQEADLCREAHDLCLYFIDVYEKLIHAYKKIEQTLRETKSAEEKEYSKLEIKKLNHRQLISETEAIHNNHRQNLSALHTLRTQTTKLLRRTTEKKIKLQRQLMEADEKKKSLGKMIKIKNSKLKKLSSSIETGSDLVQEAQHAFSKHKLNLHERECQFQKHLTVSLLLFQDDLNKNKTLREAKSNLENFLRLQNDLQESRTEIERLQKYIAENATHTNSKRAHAPNSNDFQDSNATNKEITETIALEELQKCADEINNATLRLDESLELVNQTRQKMDDLNETLKHLKNKLDIQLAKDTKPDHSSSSLQRLYRYCKSLLVELRAYTLTEPQSSEATSGMLVDNIMLSDSAYATAVKTVLGGHLANTIVVGTREEAICLSNIASNFRQRNNLTVKPNINVIITGELSMPSVQTFTASCGTNSTIFPLSDVISATNSTFERALHSKIHNWQVSTSPDCDKLFRGESTVKNKKGNQKNLNSAMLTQLQHKRLNLVTVTGQVFLADGEMRSSSSTYSSQRDTILDTLLLLDNTSKSHLNCANATMPAQRQEEEVDKKKRDIIQAETQCEIENVMTQLQLMGTYLKDRLHNHETAQLQVDVCTQHQYFIKEKWHSITKPSKRAKVSGKLTSLKQTQKISSCKLPSQETLLHEYRVQYSTQQQKSQCQFEKLVNCYKSITAAQDSIEMCQQLGIATANLKTNELSLKRQVQETRRQKSERSKLESSLKSCDDDIALLTLDIDNLMMLNLRTHEHFQMLQEDVRGLNNPDTMLSSEMKLVTAASDVKQRQRDLSASLKCLENSQKRIQNKMESHSSHIAVMQDKYRDSNEKLVLKRTQGNCLAEKANIYFNALKQDQFNISGIHTTVRRLCEDDVTLQCLPPLEESSQDVNMIISLDESNTTDAGTTTANEHIAFVRRKESEVMNLITREKQLQSKEQPLEQHLNVLKQSSYLSSFQVLTNRCDVHHQSYHQILSTVQCLREQFHELSENRFETLLAALDFINIKLDHYYKTIVPSGSCYLDYPRDRVSLLVDEQPVSTGGGGGIRLRAKHGVEYAFRDVKSLSGGQTSAVGLALLMSLQQCYPSPFVIMDEVDAALDTSTSYRVGRLLRSRSHQGSSAGKNDMEGKKGNDTKTESFLQVCQFAVISHRPEMQVWADEIVGIYIHNEFPASLSVHFDDEVGKGMEASTTASS